MKKLQSHLDIPHGQIADFLKAKVNLVATSITSPSFIRRLGLFWCNLSVGDMTMIVVFKMVTICDCHIWRTLVGLTTITQFFVCQLSQDLFFVITRGGDQGGDWGRGLGESNFPQGGGCGGGLGESNFPLRYHTKKGTLMCPRATGLRWSHRNSITLQAITS